jgi:hypothetical protein
MSTRDEIREIVNRETRAWDSQNVDLLLSVFHLDMVWPWPPTVDSHDPEDWVMAMGRFDRQRWGDSWWRLFAAYRLVHNRREIRRIEISAEGDGAFAVVDIDPLWQADDGASSYWLGRVCKVYAKIGSEWKMTMHTGVLRYPPSK